MITGKRVAWYPPMWHGLGVRLGLGIVIGIGSRSGLRLTWRTAWCHLHAAATLVKVMSRTNVPQNMHTLTSGGWTSGARNTR